MIGLIAVSALAVVAGFAYLNKKGELAIAKQDIQYAHEKLASLEAAAQKVEVGTVESFKKTVATEIAKVRLVFVKHL